MYYSLPFTRFYAQSTSRVDSSSYVTYNFSQQLATTSTQYFLHHHIKSHYPLSPLQKIQKKKVSRQLRETKPTLFISNFPLSFETYHWLSREKSLRRSKLSHNLVESKTFLTDISRIWGKFDIPNGLSGQHFWVNTFRSTLADAFHIINNIHLEAQNSSGNQFLWLRDSFSWTKMSWGTPKECLRGPQNIQLLAAKVR